MRRPRTGRLSKFLYGVTMATLRQGLLTYWQPRVSGLHHLPGCGPLLMAGNHATSLDPFLLSPLLPRRIDFIMAPQVRALPGVGRWLAEMGAIPMGSGCVEEVLQRLRSGLWVGIFPEGLPTHSQELGELQSGVAVLARRSGAPVIPFALLGTASLMPVRCRCIEGGPVEIRLGEALHWKPGESSCEFLQRLASSIQRLLQAPVQDTGRDWTPDWRFRCARAIWIPLTRGLFSWLDRVRPGNFR